MENEDPTLQDVWRLLGRMNKRFDALERQTIEIKEELSSFKGYVVGALRALKASIEARDFRLDEHGRRLTELESSR